MQSLTTSRAPIAERPDDAQRILAKLAERYSCREFDNAPIAPEIIQAILEDGLQAPSSCNHQNWHFVAVIDPELKRRARQISGGNHHFEFCSVLIYLCFQKGWTHDKFSIVQSVAAGCYHMMLSAHLRGYSTIWNAGIGDQGAIAAMLGIPATFEIQGALCIGRPNPTAPAMKAPRRPSGEVWSMNRFSRPARAVYPAKAAAGYPFAAISNAHNPYAEWRPSVWGWDRVADFRGYAVWAKSPTAGVYRSRRQGEATAVEIGFVGALGAGARLVDIMPWGGTHTAELINAVGPGPDVAIAELSEGNLAFIAERLRQEGVSRDVAHLLMTGPTIPVPDASLDMATLFQVLEHAPEPERLLDEVLRVLKPGASAVISVRNETSLYGLSFRKLARGCVPNQGPFVPLAARKVRAMLAQRFTIDRDCGVSLRESADATVVTGPLRSFCRLYIARVTKVVR